MPPSKRARRLRTAFWPDLEKDLKKWVIDKRTLKRRVTITDLRFEAQKLATNLNIKDFKGGRTWVNRFMKRNCLSIRAVTSLGQPLPSDREEKSAAFLHFINKEKLNVDLSQIGNMDEIAVSFDMPDKHTIDVTGKEDILLTTTGAEKCNFTVILCCTADGGKCDPMVIFKRKTMPKENFPLNIHVEVNPKGWVNEETMKKWIDKVWRRRKGAFFSKKSLLIYDSHRAHITSSVKEIVSKYSRLAVIPGGLTKKLQPLDLSVNKSFKLKLRNKWETWMTEGIKEYTRSNKIRRASYSEVCRWISESWKEISETTIKKSAQIQNYDAIIPDIDNDSDNENEELLSPELEEFSDILEAFNYVSDEDFDGFD